MNLEDLVGQTLDGKYFIEKELGRGGMGAVYLSTHIGTERPVAVKVIVPQFMERPEFVERFKREARAAGRLRHPNVVDVTDFGFADTPDGRVAYLVMEYLDGCTLGEILEEEKQLPLSWTLDILEQVCSAVHEAHQQGIIHRDLKPDNVWLEPNQRGGYTVKVLDFGIAKLEAAPSGQELPVEDLEISIPPNRPAATVAIDRGDTVSGAQDTLIALGAKNSTMVSERHTLVEASDEKTLADGWSPEGATILQPLASVSAEGETAILSAADGGTTVGDKKKTQLISSAPDSDVGLERQLSTSQLTRVGSVLGTPLYMSPEQCRGEKLDARSDIYSLAVIAYQMLSGKTPFTGSFTEVMDAHQQLPVPPLEARKVRKKVKKVIASSLAKSPDHRPQSAEAFASTLRASYEGLGELIRKGLVVYSQHLLTFLMVAFLISIPVILTTMIKATFNMAKALEVIGESPLVTLLSGAIELITFFLQIFTAAFLVGMVTWIVAQILAVPMRPVNIRFAFVEAKSKWKPLLLNVTASTLIAISSWGVGFLAGGLISLIIAIPLWFYVNQGAAVFVGVALAFLGAFLLGIYVSGKLMLVTPVIMIEDLRGRAAFSRSSALVSRSLRTVMGMSFLVYLVPVLLAIAISVSIGGLVRAFSAKDEGPVVIAAADQKPAESDINLSIKPNGVKIEEKTEVQSEEKKKSFEKRMNLTGAIFEIIWIPIVVLISSFTSLITALLYFKTRQAGGEPMDELLQKFEDSERPRANWQRRIRDRLVQSGRVTSNPT